VGGGGLAVLDEPDFQDEVRAMGRLPRMRERLRRASLQKITPD
jgi:hypothetical protein